MSRRPPPTSALAGLAAALLGLAALGTAAPAGNLSVTGAFDNGRVRVDSIDQAARIIRTGIPSDNHSQDSNMRFWQFRIDGITPGEAITIQHTPSRNMHYVYSYDGRRWFRFPTAGIGNQTFRFVQPSVYVAPNIAYPYGRSLELAADLQASPYVQVSNLTTSEEGRAVPMLRITDPGTPDAGKRAVWMMGRQHAFESPSSLVPDGFARWMASSDPVAAAFRTRVIAYVVPIMDVDNVYKGMTGKDQPNDFNRIWDETPGPWNAVREAKALLTGVHAQNPLLAFVDSHDPFYEQAAQWYYSANTTQWNRFSANFTASVTAAGRANRHGMAIEGFEQTATNTEKGRSWALATLGQAGDFLSLTLESPHHKDADGEFMLAGGYEQWGEAIGRALNRHLGGNETSANIRPRAKLVRNTDGSFTGAASTDPDGTIVQYRWDFGDGSTANTTLPTTTHTFNGTGQFPVSLVVVDDDGALSPAASVTALVGSDPPPPSGPEVAWRASDQHGGTDWKNSGAANGSTFRLLAQGAWVTRSGGKVALTLRGRPSGNYTVRRVTVARRDGATLDAVDSTWTAITFGNATWDGGVTVPAGATVKSNLANFTLTSGEDLFVTYYSETPPTYLGGTLNSTLSAWWAPSLDRSTVIDWAGLTGLESRTYMYGLTEIGVMPADPPTSGYEVWKSDFNWGTANSTSAGDANGDGVTNLEAYAFGFSPLDPPPADAMPSVQPGPTGLLELTFRRPPDRTDIEYTVVGSDDLVGWMPLARSVGGAAATGENGGVVVSEVLDEGTATVVVRDAPVHSDAPRRFLRVQLSLD